MQANTYSKTNNILLYNVCICLCIILCLLSSSCKNKDSLPLPASNGGQGAIALDDEHPATHKWYSFVDGDIKAIDLPRLSPPQGRRPWTEAVRASSMCSTDAEGAGVPTAYALINRLGIIEMTGKDMTLHQDASVFGSRTAGPLSFCRDDGRDVPIFSVYRSSLFNKQAGKADVLHQFLVQFEPITHIFYPAISCTNLGLDDHSEVVDYVWTDETFLCSVKSITEIKDTIGGNRHSALRTDFSYLSIAVKDTLAAITPQSKEAITISPSTKEAYRNLRMTEPFAAAPKRLRSLLGFLPGQVSFIVTCCTVGGKTPRGFVSDSGSALLSAYATLGDTYVCAMFSDGTTYFTGSLPGVSLRGEAAFRLPLLPDGWAYTSFAITGSQLYAAWEETDFYETGRSGLISVDLSKVLSALNTLAN